MGFCARGPDEWAAEAELGAGADVAGATLDVADGAALAGWVGDAAEAFGGSDIVVANVSALAVANVEENWRASFEVDLMHTVRLVEAAMPHLERSDAASIMAVSSVSGREIDFAAGPYASMKAALVHYVRGWPSTSPEGHPGEQRRRPATSTSRVGSGTAEQGTSGPYAQALASTRPAGWGTRRRWRTRSPCWPARRRASSRAPTSSWTGH